MKCYSSSGIQVSYLSLNLAPSLYCQLDDVYTSLWQVELNETYTDRRWIYFQRLIFLVSVFDQAALSVKYDTFNQYFKFRPGSINN